MWISKGIYVRNANHPIMQDGLALQLEIRQRRWQRINPECREIETDKFSFIESRRRNTNWMLATGLSMMTGSRCSIEGSLSHILEDT